MAPGKRVFIMTGGKSLAASGKKEKITGDFRRYGFTVEEGAMTGEPDADMIDLLAIQARSFRPDGVIGIGGGSVMDAAKAVSFLCRNTGRIADFLEGIGTRKPEGGRLPLIAVPTTSGTGSEATKNAPVIVRGENVSHKKSLRHDALVPDLAVVDPYLAAGAPRELTASCGMDALSQLIEAFLSTKATVMTDSLALSGLAHAFWALPLLVFGQVSGEETGEGTEETARASMAYASYLSGVTLANAGLCAVHGIAGPAGAETGMAHGTLCALLLLPCMERTIRLLSAASGFGGIKTTALEKIGVLGNMAARFLGTGDGGIAGFIDSLRSLRESLPIEPARLSEDSIVRIALQSDDKNNPVPFTEEDRIEILRSISTPMSRSRP